MWVEDKGQTWVFTMSIEEMWFKLDVNNLNPSPTETTQPRKPILVFHYYVSSEICSCKEIFGCIKDSQLSGNALTFSPMRKTWTIFPNLFLQQLSSAHICLPRSLPDGEMQGWKIAAQSFSHPSQKVWTFLIYCFNTSSFCHGRLLCSHGVPPLPPEQPDWSHH